MAQTARGEETPNGSNEAGGRDNANFECNICLDIAKDAVISLCGHLFCWGCLHRWLETRPQRPQCPVCKAGIDKDKVIPIYGRDNPNQEDPREKLPPRPQAQRPEPETNYNPFNNFSFGGLGAGHGLGMMGSNNGLQFSFGIGAFPFSLFSWTWNNNQNNPTNNNNNTNGNRQMPTARAQEEEFLSKAFLWIALFFLVWLIFA